MQQPRQYEKQFKWTDPGTAREKAELLLWPDRPMSPRFQSDSQEQASIYRIRDIAATDIASGVAHGADTMVASGILGSCYAVLIPLLGRALIRCGDREISAVPGEAALAGPSEQLRVEWGAGTALRIVRIEETALKTHVSEITRHSLERSLGFTGAMDLAEGAGRIFAEEVARSMALLEREANAFAQPVAAAAAEQMILTRLLEAARTACDSELPGRLGAAHPPIVREVVTLIEEHPEWEHTVGSLAGAVGASRRSLERAFRRHTGMSPWKYVKSVRLRRARDQLRAADQHRLTVGEVARRWGMAHSQFSADYRRVYGETPVETLQASPWRETSS
jgi:AraC-like DNA-binding protein